jgi:metal-responsive CopG/Arc/MetJ family transcriptional regulator
MSSRPIQISMEEGVLRRIDTDPETKRRGRSAFIRSAVELYLAARQRHAIDDAITRAYEGHGDDLLEEIQDLMKVQTWPKK